MYGDIIISFSKADISMFLIEKTLKEMTDINTSSNYF